MVKTIVISSHILPELAEMCTSVGIIDKGHLVLQGSIEEIHRAAAMSSPLNLTVNEEQIDDVFALLQTNPFVQKVTAQGSILKIVFTGDKEEEGKMRASLIQANIAVNSFYREEGSLESLFMQIVSGKGQQPKKRS